MRNENVNESQNQQSCQNAVMPRLSFQDLKISKEDVENCVKTNHLRKFQEGWKVYKVYNDEHIFAVKIRKPYEEGEIDFNEDSYKYEQIFLNVMNTRDYLFLKSKGYDVDRML